VKKNLWSETFFLPITELLIPLTKETGLPNLVATFRNLFCSISLAANEDQCGSKLQTNEDLIICGSQLQRYSNYRNREKHSYHLPTKV
jgi:hypothetical protein